MDMEQDGRDRLTPAGRGRGGSRSPPPIMPSSWPGFVSTGGLVPGVVVGFDEGMVGPAPNTMRGLAPGAIMVPYDDGGVAHWGLDEETRKRKRIIQKDYRERVKGKQQALVLELDAKKEESEAQKAQLQKHAALVQELRTTVEDHARSTVIQDEECGGLRDRLAQITKEVEELKLQLEQQAGPILEQLEQRQQEHAQVEGQYVTRLRNKIQSINRPTTRALPADTRYEPPIIHIKEGMARINKRCVEARGVLINGAIPPKLMERMKGRQKSDEELVKQLKAAGIIRASHDGKHDHARRLITYDYLSREDKTIADELTGVLQMRGMPCVGLTRIGSMKGGANQGIHIDMPDGEGWVCGDLGGHTRHLHPCASEIRRRQGSSGRVRVHSARHDLLVPWGSASRRRRLSCDEREMALVRQGPRCGHEAVVCVPHRRDGDSLILWRLMYV